jgi:hypothetical protein
MVEVLYIKRNHEWNKSLGRGNSEALCLTKSQALPHVGPTGGRNLHEHFRIFCFPVNTILCSTIILPVVLHGCETWFLTLIISGRVTTTLPVIVWLHSITSITARLSMIFFVSIRLEFLLFDKICPLIDWSCRLGETYVWTAATKGPIFHPAGDMWAWRAMVMIMITMPAGENSWLVHQSCLAILSGDTSGSE